MVRPLLTPHWFPLLAPLEDLRPCYIINALHTVASGCPGTQCLQPLRPFPYSSFDTESCLKSVQISLCREAFCGKTHIHEVHSFCPPPRLHFAGPHGINCLVCYWSGHLKTIHQDVGFVPVLGAESLLCSQAGLVGATAWMPHPLVYPTKHFLFVFEIASCSPDWLQICYIAKAGFELPISSICLASAL